MTRARDSEEVVGLEEEKATNIVSSWDSPSFNTDKTLLLTSLSYIETAFKFSYFIKEQEAKRSNSD